MRKGVGVGKTVARGVGRGRERKRGYPESEGGKQGQGAEVFKYFIKGSPPKKYSLCVYILIFARGCEIQDLE